MENTKVQETPKVTIESMKAKIANVHFLNLGDAARCASQAMALNAPKTSLDLITLCMVTMKNGYVVIGKSACASPENYDEELGQKYAYEDAINQLWPLEGYLLKSQLSTRNDLAAKCAEVAGLF